MQPSEIGLARLSEIKCAGIQESANPLLVIQPGAICKKIHQRCSLHSCPADKVAGLLHLGTRRARPGGRTRKYSATVRRNEPGL